MKKNIDYIIVGQGLAGTILAYTLLKNGKKIIVIDDKNLSSCSRVAAGNYNPIVFKRLVKSWKADEVIPFAETFYDEAQKFLGEIFFQKKEIAKIFADEREKNFWLKKSGEDDTYLSKEILPDFHNEILQDHFGCGVVKGAGNLQVSKFLEGFRSFFKKENLLIEEKFDFAAMKILNGTSEYKNKKAKKIIFCEGWKAMENPYFNYLPFKPAKGELLILKIKNLNTDKIIYKNGYLFSIGNDLYVAGTTYEWDELNDIPSEKGKKNILEKLKKIIKVPYEIVAQQAGVRPSSSDRRPLIGLHPQHRTLGIFNGFGTKGVMFAPYFASQFFDFSEAGKMLGKEVNIERCALGYRGIEV